MSDPLVSARWPISHFTRELSSTRPMPGGGSAAALVGTVGCSLGGKVSGILLERPSLRPAQRNKLKIQRQSLTQISRCFEQLIRDDAKAYRDWVAASKQTSTSARKRRLLAQAARCPLQICENALQGLTVLQELSKQTGPYLGSDLKAGESLLRGAYEAAQAMVEVNLKGAKLGTQGKAMQKQLLELQRKLLRIEAKRWR